MASTGWKVVQAHMPMIRFRKGAVNLAISGVKGTSPATSGSSMQTSSKGATGPNVIALPTIEDFQIPPRFRRRPLNDMEIAYINRGGPE